MSGTTQNRQHHTAHAWAAPADGRPWYRAATLLVRDRLVELGTHGGAEVTGYLGRHPQSQNLIWYEQRGDGFATLMPWRAAGAKLSSRDVVVWRPLDASAWDAELPEPVIGPLARPATVTGDADVSDAIETDGWPHPGLFLGEKIPPLSVQECEARVLRGLRTMRRQRGVGGGGSGSSWSAEWYSIMRLLQDEDKPAADGDAWLPTRRDTGDWDYALDWWRRLPRLDRDLIGYRAASPVWSWRDIADRMRGSAPGHHSTTGSHETMRQRYAVALDRLYTIARRPAASAAAVATLNRSTSLSTYAPGN